MSIVNRSQKEGAIILLLRFPLAIGVLFNHSLILPKGDFVIFDCVFMLLTNIIAGVCVPLFFFFSGYLFFQNIQKLNLIIYLSKLKRRVTSLLLPYLFWNIFFILIIAIAQFFFPSLFSGSFRNVTEFSLNDWISLFYCALGSDQPIAFQLWFIRDLLILVLLTPLFYYLTKIFNYWWLLFVTFGYVFQFNKIAGISFLSITFFGIGTFWGIKKLRFYFNSKVFRKFFSSVIYF